MASGLDATADDRLARVRGRLGDGATPLQERLVDYFQRAFGYGALTSGRAFDEDVISLVVLKAHAVVQEAVLAECRHAGGRHVECPGSLRVFRSG